MRDRIGAATAVGHMDDCLGRDVCEAVRVDACTGVGGPLLVVGGTARLHERVVDRKGLWQDVRRQPIEQRKALVELPGGGEALHEERVRRHLGSDTRLGHLHLHTQRALPRTHLLAHAQQRVVAARVRHSRSTRVHLHEEPLGRRQIQSLCAGIDRGAVADRVGRRPMHLHLLEHLERARKLLCGVGRVALAGRVQRGEGRVEGDDVGLQASTTHRIEKLQCLLVLAALLACGNGRVDRRALDRDAPALHLV